MLGRAVRPEAANPWKGLHNLDDFNNEEHDFAGEQVIEIKDGKIVVDFFDAGAQNFSRRTRGRKNRPHGHVSLGQAGPWDLDKGLGVHGAVAVFRTHGDFGTLPRLHSLQALLKTGNNGVFTVGVLKRLPAVRAFYDLVLHFKRVMNFDFASVPYHFSIKEKEETDAVYTATCLFFGFRLN